MKLSATVVALLLVLLHPVGVGAALQQVRTGTVSSPLPPNYDKAFGVVLVNALIVAVAMVILAFIGAGLGMLAVGVSPTVYFDTPLWDLPDFDALPAMVAAAVLALLALPLAVYPVWYAADGTGSIGASLREGFKAAKRNYFSTYLPVHCPARAPRLPGAGARLPAGFRWRGI